MPPSDRPLRIAHLVYRGNPHCGGQGVYTRALCRELAALGHHVEVLSGPPYPDLPDGPGDEGLRAPRVVLRRLPSLDLYRPDNPFRLPWPWELRSLPDVQELAIMCGAGYPEPYTFSQRAWKALKTRRDEFDLVHDNQCFGTGVERLLDAGWPVLSTLHHPITVDRTLDLAHASNPLRRLGLRRWYGFIDMQLRVAHRLPRHVTVSESSRRDIVTEMGIPEDRLHVVPVGTDPAVFRPLPLRSRVPGRIMTTASADVPLKGLAVLLEALAKVRTERPEAELVVIGRMKPKSTIPALITRLALDGAVRFHHGIPTERIVELYAEAEVAAVPSLYEGFSLPAVEAMACGVPVICTTGGALPEVVGRDGETGLVVPAGDPSALADGLLRALADAALRDRLGAAGRARVIERFTWHATALATVEQYRTLLDEHTDPRRERESAPC